MSELYPEWIQEQLDKLSLRRAATESRHTYHMGHRFDRVEYQLERIEAKLDRLLAYCEGEVQDQ